MIDLSKYAIILDVWEGNGDINEGILKANGIEGLMIRMNTSWGSLQYDNNFLTQWSQASSFKRGAYVVVSPENTGHMFTSKEYVDWILAWKPIECDIIALDVEIDAASLYNNPSITPLYYSNFLAGICTGLKSAGLTVGQYSGYWFFNKVAPWIKPDYLFQWWARYPDNPPVTKDSNGNNVYQSITWAGLKTRISNLTWNPIGGYLSETQTGRISMWQMYSAYTLPGCQPNNPIDVNIISRDDFNSLFGPSNSSSISASVSPSHSASRSLSPSTSASHSISSSSSNSHSASSSASPSVPPITLEALSEKVDDIELRLEIVEKKVENIPPVGIVTV